MGIVLKSERELAKMREAGRIVRAVLEAVEAACLPGVTTAELNAIAERELRRAKATSAFLGYAPGGAPPYPAVLCTSVNTVVVHGIGRAMHEPPSVPNHGRAGSGLRLRPGMVLAIEPMLNAGGAGVRMLHDGWTVVTADASLSAHVEHTVAVTDDGPRVLTAA